LAAQDWLARNEGIFVEPASGAAIAGFLKCCEAKEAAYSFQKIPAGSRIVCTVTGHGLKDPEARRIDEIPPLPARTDDVLRAIGL
jgi:threonine synthase